ncbi:TetR/AcrR family transcriptional regulator [Caballeronia sp. AZ7_KS35]|uniref:TetR/AcrR family transcriptional regulator n=1 Tax=Caballeronia sp. AZ7_KS35 TaxID=2921762 RepID=UPI002027EF61|nr:TetR/AcrR family transcriptional regulator [Caballeronia sp. AZ7_KS35]
MDDNEADALKLADPNRKAARVSIREAQRQLTRERLLDAAFEVFKEVGYHTATVEDIVKRAGSTRATFYLHFKDKTGVAADLGRRLGPLDAKDYHRLDALEHPTVNSIRGWVAARIKSRIENKVMLEVLNEAVTSDTQFAEEYTAYLTRVASRVMVRTLARWPEEERGHVRSRIVLLMIMLHRVEFHIACQGLDLGGEPAVDALADMMWKELFASAVSLALPVPGESA